MTLTTRAVAGQFVFTAFAFACLAYSFYLNDFSVLYVAQNSNSELPTFYRFAVWGAHEGSLLLWLLVQSVWTVAVAAFSRNMPASMTSRVLGVLGLISAGFALFILATSNPSNGCGPPRPMAATESAAAGSSARDSPADALHRLCRHVGAVRVRSRCDAGREARFLVGALGAAVDHGRLDVPDGRHRARQLVGLLRARLGRLVVLGSGRERVVHAVAGRHRAHSFARGDGEARAVQELDAATGDRGVLAVAARDVPGALRRRRIRARVRERPGTRPVHPRVPRDHHRWRARAVRVARAPCSRRKPASRRSRASRSC